ncbi:MAG: zinc ribbon domain-containing protein [Armatimonadota bacterium]|nr:MAG: zinc ribbon domain-containing protein [Armatimonadota bacterium]
MSTTSGLTCPTCGASLSAGAKFCHACGTPAAAARSGLPKYVWLLAGLVAIVLVAVIAYQAGRSSPQQAGAAAAGAPLGGSGAMPDLASMSPREQADRLFNRVMTAHEQGDQGSVDLFKPMALQAYAMLGALDPDAHYHVGVMQVVTGDVDAARARADSIDAQLPGHLFVFMLRHSAARMLSDDAAAQEAYRGFLANYDRENATGRQEYLDHQRAVESFREQALAETP